MNLIDIWRRLQDVDKRRIEGRLAKALWRRVGFDIAKIALLAFLLAIIILSLSDVMPPQMAELAAAIRQLYAGRTVSSLIFSGGLGGVSGATLALNLYSLPKTLKLLDDSVRTAERHVMKKSVREG